MKRRHLDALIATLGLGLTAAVGAVGCGSAKEVATQDVSAPNETDDADDAPFIDLAGMIKTTAPRGDGVAEKLRHPNRTKAGTP